MEKMMKKTMPDIREDAQAPSPQFDNADNGNLDEAIKWVYKRYGTDLPSFFRDAYKNAASKHREESDDTIEACPL